MGGFINTTIIVSRPTTVGLVLLQRPSFSFPVVDMLHDCLRRGLGRVLPSDTFDKVAFRVYNQLAPRIAKPNGH